MIPAGCNSTIFVNSVAGQTPVPWDDANGRYAFAPLPPYPYWIITPTGSPPTAFTFQFFTAAGQYMFFNYTGGGTGWTLISSGSVGSAKVFTINWWKSLVTFFNAVDSCSCFRKCLNDDGFFLDGYYPYYG